MRQTSTMQKALFKGEMKEDDNVMDFLMSQPNVMPRLNDRVLNTAGVKYVDMTGSVSDDANRASNKPIGLLSSKVKLI